MDHLLPDRQPYYVGSWVYVFGVVTIAALVWVVVSGVVLSFFGPQWWHDSSLGRFFNSLHFWSVQLFFIFMVLHLWGQYFMAGWRDGRAATWMIGVVIFGISILTAFTGYLSQQNFDAQFIAINAKDAMNAAGIGAFFNVLNFGQMYGLHVMLLPIGGHVPGRRPHRHGPSARRRQADRPEGGARVMKPMPAQTQEEYYRGVRMVPYDLVKELAYRAGRRRRARPGAGRRPFLARRPAGDHRRAGRRPTRSTSSPPRPASSPGRTTSAGYGAPYNTRRTRARAGARSRRRSGSAQRIPVDSANDFVLQPLEARKLRQHRPRHGAEPVAGGDRRPADASGWTPTRTRSARPPSPTARCRSPTATTGRCR